MLEFISQYWKLILCGLALIASIIIAAIRKRPVTDILSKIYKLVGYYIMAVERPGDGSQKKQEVIDLVCTDLEKVFPGIQIGYYKQLINQVIEDYLATPQKKER